MLTSDRGTSIVIDPYYKGVGYDIPKMSCDGVITSHHHFDHDDLTNVEGKYTCFDKAGKFTVGDITFTLTQSFHDECKGAMRGKNLISKIVVDGVTVCHMGDLGEYYSEETLKKIAPCDVLLIPVGGTYTIDGKEAKKYIDGVKPSIAIPMHFAAEGCRIDISGVAPFLKECKQYEIEKVGSQIQVDCQGSDNKTKIILMEREKQ
jgi:L-ascorbate metabolism protein UlaG (beta-lactamase superfamily)